MFKRPNYGCCVRGGQQDDAALQKLAAYHRQRQMLLVAGGGGWSEGALCGEAASLGEPQLVASGRNLPELGCPCTPRSHLQRPLGAPSRRDTGPAAHLVLREKPSNLTATDFATVSAAKFALISSFGDGANGAF